MLEANGPSFSVRVILDRGSVPETGRDKVRDRRSTPEGQSWQAYMLRFHCMHLATLVSFCTSTRHPQHELPCPVALHVIADNPGQQVSNVCANLFERQR